MIALIRSRTARLCAWQATTVLVVLGLSAIAALALLWWFTRKNP